MAHGLCSLCNVNYATSFHHMIPKAVFKKRYIRQEFNKQGVTQHVKPLCRPCHMFIHKAFTHEELALEYNTIEKMRANGLVRKFVGYIEIRVIGNRIKGRKIVIQGETVLIKPAPDPICRKARRVRGISPTLSSYQLTVEQHEALALVDSFFRTKNWQR